MNKAFFVLAAAAVLNACGTAKVSNMNNDSPNVLSERERNDGWQLLFDGQTTTGWHTYGKETIGKAWKVENGTLRLDASAKKDWQTNEGGDIVTADQFDNFDLKLEWKISPGGNSGIMFYVQEDPAKYQYPWYTGPEVQVLDNNAHADAKIPKHRAGDLYDLIPSKEAVKPVGEWNLVEVVANKGKLDFYLNGEHTLSTTMWDDNWKALIAGSKFKDMPGFGMFQSGKIALQDHGNDVWFRNIKIKRL